MSFNKTLQCILTALVAMLAGYSNSWSLNNGLALTPPMGWNSYNKFKGNVTEAQVLAVAKAFVTTGLKDAGYRYIVIDYCWSSGRNSAGDLVPVASKFPHGMKYISDSVHALGLKFGMYESPSTTTCCGEPGSYQHEAHDAQAFASWGVDYFKYDWCGVQSKEDGDKSITAQNVIARYAAMRDAIKATNHPMIFALCEKGQKTKIQPAFWSDTIGHMWRIGGDIAANWGRIISHVDANAALGKYAGPVKGWNDPDMLEVGNGSLTNDQNKSHFSLWCIMASPLMLGNDPSNMTSAVKTILTNTEAIAVNQDSLGVQGSRIKQNGLAEIWVKPLKNGDRAVVLFNGDAASATLSVNWTDSVIKWDASTKVKVRDIWAAKDSLNVTNGYSVSLPAYGSAMLRLSSGKVSIDPVELMQSENLRNAQIKKTAQGLNLYFPGRGPGVVEIVDMQGKKIHAFSIQNGWNLIPASKTVPGIFVVRVVSMRQSNVSLIVNALK